MSGRGLYSSFHDRSNQPSKSSRKKKATSAKPTQANPVTLFTPSGRLEPTEQQRIALRRRQVQAALPDEDLSSDMIPDHRRVYNVDGEVTRSEPRHRPPLPYGTGPGRRHINTLPEDVDTELDEVEKARRLQNQQLVQMQYPVRMATLSVLDPNLTALGQAVLAVNQALGDLVTAANNIKTGTTGSPATQHHMEQISLIVTEALKPWLKEIDDHVVGVVDDTKMEMGHSDPIDSDEHPLDLEE